MGRNIQAKRVRDLAAMIMDRDMPERQAQEIQRLQGIAKKQASQIKTLTTLLRRTVPVLHSAGSGVACSQAASELYREFNSVLSALGD